MTICSRQWSTMSRPVSVSELKTHCLRIVEEVARGRREVVITKRGKRVARLVPCRGRESGGRSRPPARHARSRLRSGGFRDGRQMAVRASLTPLLLDTHAWVGGSRSPRSFRASSAPPSNERAAPHVSRSSSRSSRAGSGGARATRTAPLLDPRGRLARTGDEPAGCRAGATLSLATVSIAVRLGRLRDPADQLVVATALERGARLVTSDARIADSEAVAVIA